MGNLPSSVQKSLGIAPQTHEDIFLAAATKGNVPVLAKFHEEEGVSLECTTSGGFTALHNACVEGHEEAVTYLLEKGADIHARASDGSTPLHLSVIAGVWNISVLLLEKGAEVNTQTLTGLTPLHLATISQETDCIRGLLRRGADTTLCSDKGEKPITMATTPAIRNILLAHEECYGTRSSAAALPDDLSYPTEEVNYETSPSDTTSHNLASGSRGSVANSSAGSSRSSIAHSSASNSRSSIVDTALHTTLQHLRQSSEAMRSSVGLGSDEEGEEGEGMDLALIKDHRLHEDD